MTEGPCPALWSLPRLKGTKCDGVMKIKLLIFSRKALRLLLRKGEEAVVVLSQNQAIEIKYIIRCTPKHLTRYLRDSKSLSFEVADDQSGRLIGKVTLDIQHFDVHSPLGGEYPITAANGKALGNLHISAAVDYTSVVSSFELNEHRATNDLSLPLYPQIGRRPKPLSDAPSTSVRGAHNSQFREDTVSEEPSDTTKEENRQDVYDKENEPPDLFVQLGEYLERKHTRLLELFRECDKDRDGYLDEHELQKLVSHVLPSCTVSTQQLRFFQLMLDLDGDGRVTYREFASAVRECRAASLAARHRGGFISDVIRRVTRFLADHHQELAQEFRTMDPHSKGYIDIAEVVPLLRRLLPGLTPREMRHVVARVNLWDINDDGFLSLPALQTALNHASAPPPAKAHRRSASTPQPASPMPVEVEEEGEEEDDEVHGPGRGSHLQQSSSSTDDALGNLIARAQRLKSAMEQAAPQGALGVGGHLPQAAGVESREAGWGDVAPAAGDSSDSLMFGAARNGLLDELLDAKGGHAAARTSQSSLADDASYDGEVYDEYSDDEDAEGVAEDVLLDELFFDQKDESPGQTREPASPTDSDSAAPMVAREMRFEVWDTSPEGEHEYSAGQVLAWDTLLGHTELDLAEVMALVNAGTGSNDEPRHAHSFCLPLDVGPPLPGRERLPPPSLHVRVDYACEQLRRGDLAPSADAAASALGPDPGGALEPPVTCATEPEADACPADSDAVVLELWHGPKGVSGPGRAVPGPLDVFLGVASVPYLPALLRAPGSAGWFPLRNHQGDALVGAVDASLAFTDWDGVPPQQWLSRLHTAFADGPSAGPSPWPDVEEARGLMQAETVTLTIHIDHATLPGLTLGQRTLLVLEVWAVVPVEATADGERGEPEEELVGIARTELARPEEPAEAREAQRSATLAKDVLDVWDPFRSVSAGHLAVTAVLLPRGAQGSALADGLVAVVSLLTAESEHGLHEDSKSSSGSPPSLEPRGAMIGHTFHVTVEGATDLPPPSQGEALGRYIRYQFPGEEDPLYTQCPVPGARRPVPSARWRKASAVDLTAPSSKPPPPPACLGTAHIPLTPLLFPELFPHLASHSAAGNSKVSLGGGYLLVHPGRTRLAAEARISVRVSVEEAAAGGAPSTSSAGPGCQPAASPAERDGHVGLHRRSEDMPEGAGGRAGDGCADFTSPPCSTQEPRLPPGTSTGAAQGGVSPEGAAEQRVVVICVERALHLVLPEPPQHATEQEVYATFRWEETRELIYTAAVATCNAAAKWTHSRYLPLPARDSPHILHLQELRGWYDILDDAHGICKGQMLILLLREGGGESQFEKL
eukprot:gene5699-6887_t